MCPPHSLHFGSADRYKDCKICWERGQRQPALFGTQIPPATARASAQICVNAVLVHTENIFGGSVSGAGVGRCRFGAGPGPAHLRGHVAAPITKRLIRFACRRWPKSFCSRCSASPYSDSEHSTPPKAATRSCAPALRNGERAPDGFVRVSRSFEGITRSTPHRDFATDVGCCALTSSVEL